MEQPKVKSTAEWNANTLIGNVRMLVDAYQLGEPAARIPQYERAVIHSAIEMVLGHGVWKWLEEQKKQTPPGQMHNQRLA
jgi:hypothetical protein